jgi:hypothetical protein
MSLAHVFIMLGATWNPATCLQLRMELKTRFLGVAGFATVVTFYFLILKFLILGTPLHRSQDHRCWALVPAVTVLSNT